MLTERVHKISICYKFEIMKQPENEFFLDFHLYTLEHENKRKEMIERN